MSRNTLAGRFGSFGQTGKRCVRALVAVAAVVALGAGAAQAQTASLTVTTTTVASGINLSSGGLCVDGSGNLYVASAGSVYKLTLTNGAYSAPVTLLTGVGNLGGVSVDGAGNMYLAAYGVGEILKYPYSASTGTYGAQIVLESGVSPSNIYVDGAGSVYFPNTANSTIVKLAYANGVYAAPVSIGSGFSDPQGVKNDSAGNIYVADYGNAAVKKIPYANGTYGTPISIGSGFTGPEGVVVDNSGNVFVADSTNVKEIPYSNGTYGAAIAVGSGFSSPYDVAIDALGNVYELDGGSGSVKEIGFTVPTFGTVTLGSNTTSTVSFTFLTGGTIKAPAVLTQGATGLDFTDAGTGTCTTNGTAYTYPAAATCTVVVKFTPKATGLRSGAVELLNSSGAIIATELISGVGKGPLLTFNAPTGRTISVPAVPRAIAIDASGNIYDPPASNVLYKVTSAGVSTALYTGATGANYAAAAVDGAGDVYLVDRARNVLVEVGPTGTLLRSVALGASSASTLGDVALGADGTAYIADPTDGKVITVTQLSVVSSIAVSGYTSGTGVAVDSAGVLYVTLGNSNSIAEILKGSQTNVTPTGTALNAPNSIAVDAAGDLFVTNGSNGIVVVTPAGVGTSLTTTGLSTGFIFGIALDGAGGLYFPDQNTALVNIVNLASNISFSFPSTYVYSTSTAQKLLLTNIGNAALTFPPPTTGGNPSIASGFVVGNTSTCPQLTTASSAGTLASGASCTDFLSFAPTVSGSYSGSLVTTDNTLSATGSTQSVALIGTGVAQLTKTITFPQPTTPATVGSTATLTATASNNDPVTYTVTSGTASISGNVITYTNAGTVTVAANSAETPSTQAAPTVSQTVTVSADPTAYTAPTEPVGTSSPTQTAYVNFTAAGTLGAISVVTQGNPNLDFTYVSGGTCAVGTVYSAGQACSVEYTFKPTSAGSRIGATVLKTSSGSVLGTSYISGIGTAPLALFTTATQTLSFTGLNVPRGLSSDGFGNLYVMDTGSGNVYEFAAGTGTRSTVVTVPPTGGGGATTVDGAGNVYFSAANAGYIYEIVNGTPVAIASLSTDDELLADGAGNLYASGPSDGSLWKVASGTHQLTNLLPSGLGHRFIGIGVDLAGDLFPADFNSNTLYELPAGSSTLVTLVSPDGHMSNPHGVALDPAGNIYVTNYSGSNNVLRYAAGTYALTVLPALGSRGITIDGSGNLTTILNDSTIVQYARTVAPALTFPNTAVGSSSTGGTVTLENDGNAPLAITAYAATAGFSVSGSSNTCVVGTLAAGGTCQLGASFVPATVGAQTGTATLTDNTKNVAGTQQTVALSGTATQGAQTISFTPASPVTYGVSPITLVATGGASGNPVTFTITSGGAYGSLSGTNNSVLTVTGAGSITIAANQAGSTNYSAATQVTKTVTVNKATLTAAIIGSPTKTYNGTTAATLTSANYQLTGLVGSDSFTVTQTAGTYAAAAAGTEAVSATLTSANFTANSGSLGNYNLPSTASGPGTIAQAPLTVTAGSYSGVYDGATHALSACVVSANPDSLTCTNSPAGPVGPNVGGTTVTPVVSGPTANYTVTTVLGAWSITSRPVTVTAGSYTGTYDGSAHSPSACISSYTGVACSNNPASVGPGVGSGVVNPVPTFTTGNAADYTVTTVAGSYSITKLGASVTPNVASKTYGTSDPTLTGTLSGFLAGDNVTALYSRAAGSNVGSYTISAVLSPAAALTNYNITYNTATFTVTQASASVTPNAAAKVFGTSDPTLTGSLAGFVASDNVTAVYSRTAGENVGSYTISAMLAPAAVLSNYSITYNTAAFSITPASKSISFPVLTSPVTVNATATLAATASNGDPVTYSVTSGTATISGTTVTYTNAGSVTIAADSAATANYLAAPTVTQTVSVSAEPNAYTAPTTAVGATSATQTAYVNITTAGALNGINVLTKGSPNLDFALVSGGTCTTGTVYSVGQACTVEYSFTPTAAGERIGGITLADGTGNVLGSSFLGGVGTAPVGVFNSGTQSTVFNIGDGGQNGMTFDGAGDLYYTDLFTGTLYEVKVGTQTPITIATGLGIATDVAVDGVGDLFFGSNNQNQLFELKAGTTTPVLLDTPANPEYFAVDAAGNLFVALAGSQVVEEYMPNGTTATFGTGLVHPQAIALDSSDDIFLTDRGLNEVLEITPANVQTVLASGFSFPVGIAMDPAGNLYVADLGTNAIDMLAAGTYAVSQVGSGWNQPKPLFMDAAGNIYVGDTGSGSVIELNRSTASLGFPSTAYGTVSGPQQTTFVNLGNAPLTISALTASTNFQVDASNTCPVGILASGANCVLAADFTPQTVGSLTGTLSVADNSLNQTNFAQTVALSGTGVQQTAVVTVSPATISYATPSVTLTATVAYAGATAPTGSVTFTVEDMNPVVASCSGSGSPLTCTAVYPTATLNAPHHGIKATLAADADYTMVSGYARLTVTPIAPSITFTVPDHTYGDAPVTLAAGSNSDGAITYSVVSGPASISGSTLTITGAGAVTVQASQVSTRDYIAGTQNATFHVAQAVFTVGIVGNPTKVYDGTTAATLGTANYQTSALVGTDAITVTQPVGSYAAATAGPETVTAALAAGNFTATSGMLSNYILPTSASGAGTITPASLTATAGSYSGVYDGASHALSTCVVSANPDGLTCTNSPVGPVGPDVGGTTVTPVISGSTGNYSVTTVNGAWSITAKPVTITAGSYSGTYDGNAHAPSACTSSYAGVTCTDSPASVGPGVSSGTVNPVASYTTGGAADYTITPVAGSYSITKAPASVTPNATGKVYGAADPVLTGTTSGFLPADGVTATYSRTVGETVGGSPYTISAALGPLASLSNYSVTYNTAAFTITPAPTTTTVSCPVSVTYNGAAQTPCTASVSGAGGLTQTLTVTYTANVNAGVNTATATANFSGDSNHTGSTQTVNFTIAPAVLSVTAGSYSGVYDGAAHTVSACSVGANFDGITCADSPAQVGPDTGSGAVTPVVSGPTANYTLTSNNGSWSITAKPVTITAGSYSGVYDGNTHTVAACTSSYTGVGCTDSPASVGPAAGSGVVNPVVSYAIGNASDYQITPQNGSWSIAQATSATTITCPTSVVYNGTAQTPCTASVTGAGGLSQSATVSYTANTNVGTAQASATYAGDVNHTGSTKGTTFAVTAAPLTVTAGSYSGVYDGSAHPLSACVVSSNPDGLTCTNNPVGPVGPNVGGTVVTPVISGSTANYTVTTNNSSWSITAKPVTITAGSYSGTYDGNTHTPSACTSSYAGVACADSPASVGPGISSGTVNAVASFTAGSAADYTVTTVAGSYSITPLAASVTPNPATKVYGTSDPALTGTLSGFLPADGVTATYSRTAGESVGGSPYTISATLSPTAVLANYAITYKTAGFTITQATPTISWTTPAAITYGTALSGTQLNATASVAGTLAYTPAAGTVLGAGTQTLKVSFTPTDTTDYTAATGSVTLTVNQATPVVTWANPPSIVYGTGTGSAQKTATATGVGGVSLPGSYFYTTPDGTIFTVGTHPLGVGFTPTDITDYVPVSAYAFLTVTKATPTVTWAAPAAITYGTALSATQLNAMSTVAGTYSYSPAAGTVLHAGTQTLSVTFTPTDTTDYNPYTATVTLVVNKATPVITWPTPAAITYGTPLSTTQLDATANVAGTFLYTAETGNNPLGVLLVPGTTALSATITPTDTTDYNSATAYVVFTVSKAQTTTTLAITTTQTVTGTTATITATVHPQIGGTPTGTVTYYNGSTALGSTAVGTPFTTGVLPLGADQITAVYSGDSNFVGSSSSASAVTGVAPTVVQLSTVLSNVFYPVSAVSFTVVVPLKNLQLISGTVTLYDGSTVIGTYTLPAGGVLVAVTPQLGVGTHHLMAVYSGNAQYPPGESAVLTVTVSAL